MYRVFNSWFIFCTAFSWLIPGVVYTNRSTGTGWSDILNAFKNNLNPAQPKPSNAHHLGKSHPCTRYSSWNRVNPIWDNMLLKQNMVVCRKNYGADGNCLFNAVSGILRDHKVSRDTLQLKLTNLPAAVSLSLDDMQFQDTYYTVGDLRRIIAVRFIGVDPHNENALPFWDVSELVGKLEVLSNVEGTQDFGDIRWGPTKILREIRQNGDLLDIAKRLFAMLSQVQNPYSWGSYEDIDTMAEIFNMDIYLFFSDQTKIQRFVGSRPDNEQRPVLLLYYHVMTHFDAAGIIQNATSNKGQPIRSMFSIDGCPKLIRQLAAQ